MRCPCKISLSSNITKNKTNIRKFNFCGEVEGNSLINSILKAKKLLHKHKKHDMKQDIKKRKI